LFAYTLIRCEPGKYTEVVEKVKEIKGVADAFGVHGRWDVVAEIEADNLKALGEIALKINGLKGVASSETLIGFEPPLFLRESTGLKRELGTASAIALSLTRAQP